MDRKLGLPALTALVLSSMLGAGVFSLPQNMAAVAGASALMTGWAITGIGIILLALSLLLLSRLRPDLDGGIFSYAHAGFGDLVGFFSAWGYWLCAVVANVSYLVIVFAALSYFTDSSGHVIFGDGTTWQSIVGSSLLLWMVHVLLLCGIQTASSVNLLAMLARLIPLGMFIVLALSAFDLKRFTLDFHGITLGTPWWQQVKNTMLITLWVFIGVEGAVVVSARARHKKDIGRATMLAVFSALSVYLLVTLISLGIVPRQELAAMHNPSMAGLMSHLMGTRGYIIIAAGLIISVCGAYLSWTILAAEIPWLAARKRAFPACFNHQNKHGAPAKSLWLTNGSIQICLIAIWLTGAGYTTLLALASEMVLIPYFLVGAWLLKLGLQAKQPHLWLVGGGASLYGLWLLYASGPSELLLSAILYAPGIAVFLLARSGHTNCPPLKKWEKAAMALLILAAGVSLWILINQA